MAIKNWHFQHRDGHTTQKVKKIVVSKTHFIKKYWSDFNKKNFDVKIEGIWILGVSFKLNLHLLSWFLTSFLLRPRHQCTGGF